jgi:sialic acid synthase SpsE
MRPFVVRDHVIGARRTFIVAELGINHNGDPALARRLVREAAAAGADAVKLQTYVTELRAARDSPIHENLRRCELGHDAQRELQRLAHELGVVFFSTPFDAASVAFLERLEVPLYKIASCDLVNHALLREVAATGRPVLLSRGMADRAEIDAAVELLARRGCAVALLHCVSAYPTPAAHASLRAIRTLAEAYDRPVGFSDHTLGIEVAALAVAAGACVIEKHFTLDRSMSGPDQALSADPAEMRSLVARVRAVEQVLGTGELRCLDVERDILRYRRPS